MRKRRQMGWALVPLETAGATVLAGDLFHPLAHVDAAILGVPRLHFVRGHHLAHGFEIRDLHDHELTMIIAFCDMVAFDEQGPLRPGFSTIARKSSKLQV